MITRKAHNSYSLKYNQNISFIKFGKFGIKILSFGNLTENQFNSINRSLANHLKKSIGDKKKVKVWSLVLLNSSVTKLSSESRMGKGKGNVYNKAVFLKPGTILFEFSEISKQQMNEVFNFLKKKVTFKITLMKNQFLGRET